ncbi:MAG: NAD-dependent epimerase/dehydratase family protein [Exilispira sp.]
MKILITGATGFIGQNLLSYILNNDDSNDKLKLNDYEIYAFVLPGDKFEKDLFKFKDNKNFNIIHGDITRKDDVEIAVNGIDIVIHLAGLISYWKKDLDKLNDVNIKGTENIVNACIKFKVKKLIHISSVGAIGFYKNGLIADEQVDFNYPANLYYMVTKYKGQKVVESAIKEKGLNAIILCPASIMGPGDPDINTPHNQIYKKVFEGKMFGCFSGGLAVVDVRDIVKIIIKILKYDYPSDKYLIVGKNLKYKEVIKTIERYSSKKTYPFIISPLILSIAGFILEVISIFTGKKPLLTYGYGKLSGWNTYYSNEKSIKTFNHSYIDFDKTIKDSCKYFEEKFIKKSI